MKEQMEVKMAGDISLKAIGGRILPRGIARRPVPKTTTYLKYGFAVTEDECFYCPRCRRILNAGPEYQPNYCSQCGQRVTFRDTGWKGGREAGWI